MFQESPERVWPAPSLPRNTNLLLPHGNLHGVMNGQPAV